MAKVSSGSIKKLILTVGGIATGLAATIFMRILDDERELMVIRMLS